MPTISIKRRHKLDHKKAKAAAQKIAKRPSTSASISNAPGTATMFRSSGPGSPDSMRVGKNDVELNVQLSFLLTPLKGPIEHAIRNAARHPLRRGIASRGADSALGSAGRKRRAIAGENRFHQRRLAGVDRFEKGIERRASPAKLAKPPSRNSCSAARPATRAG